MNATSRPILRAVAALLLAVGFAVAGAGNGLADDDDGGFEDDEFITDDDGGDDDGFDDDAGDDGGDDDDAPSFPVPPIVDHDGDPTTDGYRSAQAIIRLAPGADLAAFTARHGTTVLRAVPSRGVYLLQLAAGTHEPTVEAALEDDPDTVWAELSFTSQAPEGRPRHFFVSAELVPGPPADEYAPALIGLAGARACAGGGGVTVAVIDTGVDASHPELFGRVLRGGWNTVDDLPDTADAGNGLDDDGDGLVDEMTGHGTHVAGIVARVAPGAVILPIKALDSDGVGDAFSVAAGIYHAIDRGARVINLSLGSTHDAVVTAEAIAEARAAGILVVAAAGNMDREQPAEYPAVDPNAFGVAATDGHDRKSAFSNYHPALELSAPGVEVVSAFPGAAYAGWSGTSMAAPFVAGGAALLLAEHSGWSADQVAGRLTETSATIDALNPAYAGKLGAGRLDVGEALACPEG